MKSSIIWLLNLYLPTNRVPVAITQNNHFIILLRLLYIATINIDIVGKDQLNQLTNPIHKHKKSRRTFIYIGLII